MARGPERWRRRTRRLPLAPRGRDRGPRGSARGRQVLKDWVARANVRLAPLRLFQRNQTVVVEEAATWRDALSGETIGEATVATAFELGCGPVTGVFRHDGLEDALRGAGLDGSDEIRAE